MVGENLKWIRSKPHYKIINFKFFLKWIPPKIPL